MSKDTNQASEKQKMRLEMRNINDLIPYENNARMHSVEQIEKLRASLRQFKFVNPILIDGNNNIIAGHGRVEAARREGINEVPCVLVEHLTDTQRRAYILADNRLAEDASGAGWNMDIVRAELATLSEFDFNIELTGFNFDDVEALDLNDSDDVQSNFMEKMTKCPKCGFEFEP